MKTLLILLSLCAACGSDTFPEGGWVNVNGVTFTGQPCGLGMHLKLEPEALTATVSAGELADTWVLTVSDEPSCQWALTETTASTGPSAGQFSAELQTPSTCQGERGDVTPTEVSIIELDEDLYGQPLPEVRLAVFRGEQLNQSGNNCTDTLSMGMVRQ